MKKLRYFYWLSQSFAKKHFIILILAAILGAVSYNQSARIIKLLPKPKPTTYVGRVVFDSSLGNLPKDIQILVSDGLTQLDDTGSPQPDLARDWQIQDNGKTYVFHLKDNLTWQDGTPLVASDIQYSFKDVQIEAPDERTVVFHLQEPFAPFPNIVSQPIFKRTKTSIFQLINRTDIIGTSNYRITKLSFSGNYLDKITLDSKTDKRVYRFYTTEKAARTAFKLAEVDVLEDITDPGELVTWNNVTIDRSLNTSRYLAVFFNTRNQNLTDKSIRQALTYTIPDKPAGDGRALGPESPKSWAFNPKVKPYDYSLDTAKSLLENLQTDFTLELITTPTYQALAEKIKTSWEQLGITVKIKVLNLPDTNNYDALLVGQQIPQDPDQYLLWHSTQVGNITGYQNAKVDKLLEDGRKEVDPAKRKEIYLDFQRFLVEDTPAAFISYLDSVTIKRK